VKRRLIRAQTTRVEVIEYLVKVSSGVTPGSKDARDEDEWGRAPCTGPSLHTANPGQTEPPLAQGFLLGLYTILP